MSAEPCRSFACPCLAAPPSVFCAVHTRYRSAQYSGMICPVCRYVIRHGDQVVPTEFGDRHKQCPKGKKK